jgi:hypothetical protein
MVFVDADVERFEDGMLIPHGCHGGRVAGNREREEG